MSPEKFPPEVVETLLVKSQRCCCLCHEYKGSKIEVHHIDPKGGNDEDNGIPLCFDCHAEVGAYNKSHPKGRKFSVSELKKHRDQWFKLAKERYSGTNKIVENQDTEIETDYIEELPQGGGYFNFITNIGEKYVNWQYGEEIPNLIKERLVVGFLGILSFAPLGYYYYYKITSSDFLLVAALFALIGFILISTLSVIENTKCEKCDHYFGKKIVNSKLISEKAKNYKDKIVTTKKYDTIMQCKKCGYRKKKTIINKQTDYKE